MTTIAFDGKRLAFDSRMVCSGFKSEVQTPKAVLRRYTDKSVLYAVTGAAGWLEAWIAWAEAGSVPADRPFGDDDMTRRSTIIRVMDGKAEMCTHGMPYWVGVPAPDAWGSGCEYAIGAMKAGADAFTAVVIASDCDVNTGGVILCLHAMHPDEVSLIAPYPLEECACPKCHAAAVPIEPALGVTHPLDVADLLTVEGYIDAPKLSAVYLQPLEAEFPEKRTKAAGFDMTYRGPIELDDAPIVTALADVRCGLSNIAAVPQNVTAEALEAAMRINPLAAVHLGPGRRVIGREDICTHGYVRRTCETCRHNHIANLYPV